MLRGRGDKEKNGSSKQNLPDEERKRQTRLGDIKLLQKLRLCCSFNLCFVNPRTTEENSKEQSDQKKQEKRIRITCGEGRKGKRNRRG